MVGARALGYPWAMSRCSTAGRVAGAALLSALAGCQSFANVEPGSDAGRPPDASGTVEPIPDAAASRPLILHVSPVGRDEADGRSPAAAVRSLRAALRLAETSAPSGAEIHVCKGRYGEPTVLSIDRKVTVRGGYDCATFARPSGYPNARATIDPSESVVFKSVDDGAVATLRFLEGASGALLEGLTVEAGTFSHTTSAVFVGKGASVELLETRLVLGSGVGDGVFGTGLDVSEGAVTVRRCAFRGTRGRNPTGTGGNLAYLLNAASSRIEESTFEPGEVSGLNGVVHLTVASNANVAATQVVEVERNVFLGGSPELLGGTANTLLFAMNLTGPVRANVRENQVRFATHSCPRGCINLGVAASSGAEVVLERNLIDLGEVTTSAGMVSSSRGISAGGGALRAENNVVLLQTTIAPAVSSVAAIGLSANAGCGTGSPCVIPDAPPVVFRHNTVHMGPDASLGRGTSVGAYLHAKRVTLDQNVFFGGGRAIGVQIHTSRGASVDAARGNVFV